MRNYSRKFRRNNRGGNPFAGLLGSSDPNKAVQDAQAKVVEANNNLKRVQDEAAATLGAPASSGFKLPFTGGSPSNEVQKATNSVTSGVSSGVNALGSGVDSGVKTLGSGVDSGVKALGSMLPNNPFKGGRRSNRRSRKQSRKNKQSRRNRRR
jgi:hypothetical protein